MPDMQKLQNTMGDSIQIVGIDLRESRSLVLRFVTRYGYTWTFVLDSTREVGNTYEVSGIPRSFFIDAKGVIIRVLRGGPQRYETFLEGDATGDEQLNKRSASVVTKNTSPRELQ